MRDLVPGWLRREWVACGYCPGRDLFTAFGGHVRRVPGRVAVVDCADAVALDYAALDARVRGLAGALVDAGLGCRDIVAVRVPNGWRAVVAELAVAAIGALALPVPSGFGDGEAARLLRRARADALIGEPVAGLAVQAFPVGGPAFPVGGPGAGFVPAAVDPGAPARVLVSSGTEADPKMVVYSHDAMLGGRGNYVGALCPDAAPVRALLLVPLSSSFGSCGTSVVVARHGGTLVLLPRFDAAAAMDAVAAHRPTHVLGVPTMLARMAALGVDRSRCGVRAVVSSGAPLDAATARECRERFGAPVVNVYGSADGVNCHTGGAHNAVEPTAVGRPDPAVAQIRVVDGTGRVLPAGTAGEICARGPMTPLCYLSAPELDARYRLPGGWVRTGDRGLLDADGTLHVLDRLKRVVVRGGENISPAEIERELRRHPRVADAACVAVPDADLGERLCAAVVGRDGAVPTLDELNRFLSEDRGVSRRKLPERLLALEEFPLGPTGKVCHRTLAALLRAG